MPLGFANAALTALGGLTMESGCVRVLLEWLGIVLLSQVDLFAEIFMCYDRSDDSAYGPTTSLTPSTFPHEQTWKRDHLT